ncbi:thiamine-monophosphate kinase [Rhizomicrobium palustre]|uniref:Thiamine-monophosphate kinase n=1 Tax=Rhizomicrobium palustre TaxID=189966 RepID=A0A846N1E1_9PROT|nr:thiamine-phosphate kinase [Rhizomicrobium palustre]NIK89784.1 thiamine-monophosphate kinase [Rhizomicrobium palustre]
MNRSISEFALIARYFAPLATDRAALGLKDDACVLEEEAGRETIITADALVEGVHFLPDDPPELIAAKALRVNLSDLASKGATPRGYLMALALPRQIEENWIAAFARGLEADQTRFGISLLGGDTTATPGPLTIAITALGTAPKGVMLKRGGARPGEAVYVSGTIGDAGGGLQLLQGRIASSPGNEIASGNSFLIERYRRPTPRLALGKELRRLASAALDVSDGLIADLGHIAEVSKLSIVLEAEAIPRSPELAALWPGQDGIVRAATAGDDYEIAFTAPLSAGLPAAFSLGGVTVTKIGYTAPGDGVVLLNAAGNVVPVPRPGFVHF